jgi:hypothetical protein
MSQKKFTTEHTESTEGRQGIASRMMREVTE